MRRWKVVAMLIFCGRSVAGLARPPDDPPALSATFLAALSANGVRPPEAGDLAGPALLRAYGSLFVARTGPGLRLPPRLLLDSAEAVKRFQQAADLRAVSLGGVVLRLQPAAAAALASAVRAA